MIKVAEVDKNPQQLVALVAGDLVAGDLVAGGNRNPLVVPIY